MYKNIYILTFKFSIYIRLRKYFNSWSINFDDALILSSYVKKFAQNNHIKILEFGSGASTVLFSHLAKLYFRSSQVDVYENDKSYSQKIKKDCKKMSTLQHKINFFDWESFPDLPKDCNISDNLTTYDFIFIDSPPDTINKFARVELCKKLIPELGLFSCIAMHDTNRLSDLFGFYDIKNLFFHSKYWETEKGISTFLFKKP